MGKVIRMFISSAGAETDATTVDDLLDQLRDYFDIVRDVEEAIAESGGSVIVWRIVGASKNSPIALDVEAYPRVYAVNIDNRANLTVQYTALGLHSLQVTSERPPYFSEKALGKAERFFERVMNGLGLTKVDHGEGLPQIVVTPEAARVAARNTIAILKPAVARPYREIGSLEGTFQRVERDGRGRPLLFIRHRLTGDTIKCVVSDEARAKVEQHVIGEIWRGRRVEVFGTIHYRSIGRINQVDASDVIFLRDRRRLPQIEDIEDTEFTGGLRSEDYLAKLRDGELS
jgi:hypothetical protein